MITRSKARKRENVSVNNKEEYEKREEIENVISFKEAIFEEGEMLCSDDDMNIEGMKYEEIEKDDKLKGYLERLKDNLPKYEGMSNQQKAHYFRKITKCYLSEDGGNEIKKDNNDRKSVSFRKSEDFAVFDQNLCPNSIVFITNNELSE